MNKSILAFGLVVLAVIIYMAMERDKRARAAEEAKNRNQGTNTATGSAATASTSTGGSTTASTPINGALVLRRGSTGAEVRELQTKLNSDRQYLAGRYPNFLSAHGSAWPSLAVDGNFGQATESALKRSTLMTGREVNQISLEAYRAVTNFHRAPNA